MKKKTIYIYLWLLGIATLLIGYVWGINDFRVLEITPTFAVVQAMWVSHFVFYGFFLLHVHRLQKKLILSIQHWDMGLQNDIQRFIKKKSMRLFVHTLLFMFIAWGLVLKLKPDFKNFKIILQGYVVLLFHVSLVSSVFFFKLIKMQKWITQENAIEKEQPE